jgi:predicted Fe-Mo cluster-binding NifX family protein
MKIAVASNGPGGLEDTVSPVFGRCPAFTIVEVQGNDIVRTVVMENPAMNVPGGAGIQIANTLIREGVNVVIAGNFGPNATPIFVAEGIELIPLQNISVRDAVMKYVNKEITAVQAPPGAGPAPGMGRGMGRGMGSGRGMGRRGGGGGGGMRQMPVYPPGGEQRFVCSSCGCTMPGKPGMNTMKCPNCGADMQLM